MNIVCDIGGTNMRLARAEGDELAEIRKVPTPQDPQEGMRVLRAIVAELGGGELQAFAGGIAADYVKDGILSGATNLPLWNGLHFVEELASAFKVPVVIVNDTVAAGIAERERGAGKGFATVVYLTVSTGVGGARIGEDMLASPILRELHEKMGDLEGQISGTAVRKKFGIEPKDLDSIEERNALADILAAGLSTIDEAWQPDAFVIGGSMVTGMNPIPLERVRERFTAKPIEMAALGDRGGLYGGIILAESVSLMPHEA